MSNNAGPKHPWRANGKAIRGRKPLPEGYLAAHRELYGEQPPAKPTPPKEPKR
jgi:hypothetical protein